MATSGFLGSLLSPDQISDAAPAREEHARDWGTTEAEASEPDIVVWPESTDDVAAVLEAANDRGVPVTPFAGGTGVEGNAVPSRGGICLDLTRMDAIEAVRPRDKQIDVEPGATGEAVNEAAASHGLLFPPTPESDDIATIGGMIATNAGGKGTVKYGKVGDWVRELEVVLADGSVVTMGTRAEKSSSGYNLRDLIVGSEGTLGVVTRATLGLVNRPAQTRVGRVTFETINDAAAATTDIVGAGIDVSAVEFIDGQSAVMVNDYIGSTFPEGPSLFFEFQADQGIEREIDACRDIVEEYDLHSLVLDESMSGDDVWKPRREVADAVREYYPDLQSVHAGDVAVPLGSLSDIVGYIHDLSAEHDVPIPTFGHAGDGNIHFDILIDPTDDDAVTEAAAMYESIVRTGIELGGTATGEHGIGRGKRKFLQAEHGETGVDTMRAIKNELDPNGILNPDTVLPAE
jgi:D-lactate dehydrogenase (cytochrome)